MERREQSEQALLAAAAEVIAERGMPRASFAEIAQRAGTSRNLPAHHFGSKDVLIARVAERIQERVSAATISAIEARDQDVETLPALEVVRTTVDLYLRRFEDPTPDDRALIVMWGATFPAEAELEGMLEADRRAYIGWAEVIRWGQDDGSIRPDADPAASAVVLHGLMRGVAALLLTEADTTDMTHVRATVDDWITSALARG